MFYGVSSVLSVQAGTIYTVTGYARAVNTPFRGTGKLREGLLTALDITGRSVRTRLQFRGKLTLALLLLLLLLLRPRSQYQVHRATVTDKDQVHGLILSITQIFLRGR